MGFLRNGEEEDEVQQRMKWGLFDRRIRRKLFRAAGIEKLDSIDQPDGDDE